MNIQHSEPSLLRSMTVNKLSLTGLVDGRLAGTEVSELSDEAMAVTVARLFDDAQQRHQWMSTSADVTSEVMADSNPRNPRNPR